MSSKVQNPGLHDLRVLDKDPVIALCSSPVVYWSLPTWRVPLLVSYLFGISYWYFILVHGVLRARILEWFTILSSSGPLFVKTLHYDLSVLHDSV